MRCIYQHNTVEQCRLSYQSESYPINEQCDNGPRPFEFYTPALCASSNCSSSLHSIDHLHHEACRQHIYVPPSQKPAGNFLRQITLKRYLFTIAIKGKGTL
jgi:hypothetical protein